MLALIQVLGGDALVRLHQARVTGLGPGQNDKVIPWEKPPRPGGCPLSAEEYAALPGEITVRDLMTHTSGMMPNPPAGD